MLVFCQMCTLKSTEELKQNEHLSSWLNLIQCEFVSDWCEYCILQDFLMMSIVFHQPTTIDSKKYHELKHGTPRILFLLPTYLGLFYKRKQLLYAIPNITAIIMNKYNIRHEKNYVWAREILYKLHCFYASSKWILFHTYIVLSAYAEDHTWMNVMDILMFYLE